MSTSYFRNIWKTIRNVGESKRDHFSYETNSKSGIKHEMESERSVRIARAGHFHKPKPLKEFETNKY